MSRNVAFNENDESKELEDFVQIPGLQAEGENYSEGTPSQIEPKTQEIIPKNPMTPPNISEVPVIGLKIEYLWIIHFSLILYSNRINMINIKPLN